jgi:hypothetical protein
MGAAQSTTQAVIDVQNRVITEMRKKEEASLQQIAQLAEPVSKPEWILWEPAALSCMILLGTREDGSTYRELYVPQWQVTFFDDNGQLGVREQDSGAGGKLVNVYEAHAILLHNAYMKWCEYRKAANIGLVALNYHLNPDTKL